MYIHFFLRIKNSCYCTFFHFFLTCAEKYRLKHFQREFNILRKVTPANVLFVP